MPGSYIVRSYLITTVRLKFEVTYLNQNYSFPLEMQEIPMSLTCNGFNNCDDGSDEAICKGNHDKKSYAIISAILGKTLVDQCQPHEIFWTGHYCFKVVN